MPPDTLFTEDYYMRGPQTGLSNYENYSWLPAETLALADKLRWLLHLKDDDRVLDVGCARGYVVKALRMRGVDAWGQDISEWAVASCDPAVKNFVSTTLEMPPMHYTHVICKDVLEHIPLDKMKTLLETIFANVRKSALFIVPLSYSYGGRYVRDEDEADSTHITRWPLENWLSTMQVIAADRGYVTGSWHYPGLKPASLQVPKSCGFLQFTRA